MPLAHSEAFLRICLLDQICEDDTNALEPRKLCHLLDLLFVIPIVECDTICLLLVMTSTAT